jgi:perosamine synthetase
MDPSGIAQLVGPRTRAIMPVHIYGHPVDMDAVLDVARKHGLAVIEDAAEAHGAEYLSAGADWRRCGGFGELSCFSFYANKLVTSGEGGMVLTDSDALAEKARRLRNLAFGPGRRFRHEELGFNFRMTNLQAALAIPQIERMHEIVGRKRAIAAQYAAALAGVRGIQLPVEEAWARSVYWMYGIVIDTATGRDAESVAAKLAESGIETRPFFLGLHEQPALRRLGLFSGASYPMTERLARQGLYLPSGIGLRADDIGAVAEAVRQALA